MKNRYRNSDYDQQWTNDNGSEKRNQSQFNNDRYRQSNSDYNRNQYRNDDLEGPDYNYRQSNGGSYSAFGDQDYQNSGDSNWYGRQYENQYNSNRPQYNKRFDDYRPNDYKAHGNNEKNFRDSNDYSRQDRGWWDKTTDEVSSWFGDDEAKRRRRMDELRDDNLRGKGPKNYTRSSERIKEDVNDHLGDHWMLDASNIEVNVDGTEVTLTGSVDSKENKRRAEDIADSVSGVTHVQNNLRVSKPAENNDITNDNNSKVGTSDNYKTRKEAMNHN
ncbi:MAG: BON domain-containing protein [Bacteroidota bacterium]|nr:BON domain-containing protein [Bacteroidota bacterium]